VRPRPPCCGLGRRGVDRRPLQVVAVVEVSSESVSQVLGGEVVQRCRGHGSCERSDIVSLIIDSLHELRQRRPVALSEESLVELASQGRPPLLQPDRSRFGRPFLDVVDALQGTGGGPPGIDVPLLDMGEQGPPDRWQGKVEAGADGVAGLVPTFRGRATAIPPVPAYIEVWRSVRATGDTKTRRSRRTLALPGRCIDALRSQRVQQAADRLAAGPSWKESGLVFATAVGSEMDPANVRRDLRRALKLVPGLEPKDWTPRELRHSFVSLLSDAGVPVEMISQLVGHRATSSPRSCIGIRFGRSFRQARP
jgi:Phage integrase family